VKNPQELPGSQLKRLTVLSKNVNDAISEIFSMSFTQAYQELASQSTEGGPNVKLIEKNLWVNSIMIPLLTRDRTLDLVQAFFCSEGPGLKKEEIMMAVYGAEQRDSHRYRESLDTRLTKLLSRTRKFLSESLEAAHLPFHLDWLVYDLKTRSYYLYKIRTDFLKQT
jgi:hypothetical protein